MGAADRIKEYHIFYKQGRFQSSMEATVAMPQLGLED